MICFYSHGTRSKYWTNYHWSKVQRQRDLLQNWKTTIIYNQLKHGHFISSLIMTNWIPRIILLMRNTLDWSADKRTDFCMYLDLVFTFKRLSNRLLKRKSGQKEVLRSKGRNLNNLLFSLCRQGGEILHNSTSQISYRWLMIKNDRYSKWKKHPFTLVELILLFAPYFSKKILTSCEIYSCAAKIIPQIRLYLWTSKM